MISSLTAVSAGGSREKRPAMITRASLYQSTLFIFGIVLIILGIGNTVVAQVKVRQYQADLAQTPPSIDAEQTFGKNARLHHFSSEAWSRWALAQAKLDFYQVLPEMEVAVEEAEVVAGAPVVERSELAAPVDGPFVIQVASFRQLTDADRVKASLALIGLEGQIQTVSIEGQTWHRVRLGPFNELIGLNDVRSRLYENDFDGQVY